MMTSFLVFGGIFLLGILFAIMFVRWSPRSQSFDWIKIKTENDNLKTENQELKNQNQAQREEMVQLREEKARLETEKTFSEKNLESVKNIMKLEFQKTAKNLFAEQAEASRKNISNLIQPLKQDISQFQERINRVHGENQKERASLEVELKKIHGFTNRLEHIFQGHSKVQGGFGEVVLERILVASGLRKGEEFILQGEGLGLKNPSGDSLKPDVTVLLPDDKRIFIDSKVSLTDYYKHKEAKTEGEREKYRKNIVLSITRHIKDLAGKYSSLEKAPDFTLMFFPEEGAFTLALQTDKKLYQKAWKEGIVIIGPTTLYATLKTISFVWKTERQNRNAKQIADESGRLYDKFIGFLEDMDGIKKHLEKAQDSYESAFNKLSTGRGNLVVRAEKVKQLGARTTKSLPDPFNHSNEQQGH